MKYSYQREKILETVKDSCDHPTAERIYQRVKTKIPNISLGTVYRNLNFLADNCDILKISMTNGDRFDKTVKNHSHFRCTKCNNVFDVDYFDINDLPIKDNQNIITKITINFEGICKNCQKK